MGRLILLLSLLAVGSAAHPSLAQDFSSKPIRIIVGAPAGGATDIVARLIGEEIRGPLNTSVVIENISGGFLQPAFRALQTAEPDGHALMMMSTSIVILKALHQANLSYSLGPKDVSAIRMIASGPLVLVTRPDSGVNSVRDLVAKAKAEPGKLTFASQGGVGTLFDFTLEMFKKQASINVTTVPYKGGAQSLTDLLGGHIDFMFEPLPTMLGPISDKRVVAVATTGAERWPALSNTPTMIESGFAGFEANNWWGLLGTGGIPRDKIDKINTEVSKALAKPSIIEALVKLGARPRDSGPDQFRADLDSELQRWTTLVKEQGIKAPSP